MRWSRGLTVLLGVAASASCGGIGAAEPADDAVVVLVRHAEKEAGDDPALDATGRARARDLAHALSEWPDGVIYVSQFRRTQETAAPLAEAWGIEPVVVDARDVRGLAARIREGSASRVVVIGHSNTVPAIVGALGATAPEQIAEEVYDDLFVVTLEGGGARLVRLKYGAPTPAPD